MYWDWFDIRLFRNYSSIDFFNKLDGDGLFNLKNTRLEDLAKALTPSKYNDFRPLFHAISVKAEVIAFINLMTAKTKSAMRRSGAVRTKPAPITVISRAA